MEDEPSDEEVAIAIASIPEPDIAAFSTLLAWKTSVAPELCNFVFDLVIFSGPTAESVARGVVDKLVHEEMQAAFIRQDLHLEQGVTIPDGVFHHLIDRRSLFSMCVPSFLLPLHDL